MSSDKMCMWWKDSTIPQLFHTDCGTAFQINGHGDTPKQLEYDYCPNCGGHIDFDHSESEDECETCGGSGEITPESWPDDEITFKQPCPDCTDESEGYSEPRPEDEEWRHIWVSATQHSPSDWELEDAGINTQNEELITAIFMDYINDLESELQDVREELEAYKDLERNHFQCGMDIAKQRDTLRERIEEVRKKLEPISRGDLLESYYKEVMEALEILSEDSDEGDTHD